MKKKIVIRMSLFLLWLCDHTLSQDGRYEEEVQEEVNEILVIRRKCIKQLNEYGLFEF